MQNNHRSNNGFTLIELSIVLVIIGFIVGGVLVGQDLIQAANDRAVATQIEKYNTAVNTFIGKYNQLPGDMSAAAAAQYGFMSRNGNTGHGDANGVIEGCASGSTAAGCETILFWSDLSTAGLIPASISFSTTYANSYINTVQLQNNPLAKVYAFAEKALNEISPISIANAMVAPPSNYRKNTFPAVTALGNNAYLAVFAANASNSFQLSGITSTDTSGNYTTSNIITPKSAYNIDSKIDDALPLTGRVQASAFGVQMTAGASNCVYNVGTPSPYNITTSYSRMPICQLSFQMQ